MSIEAELRSVTRENESNAKNRTDYLVRVAKAIGELPDSKYNKLSKSARDWADDASKALNNRKRLPEFSEYDPKPKVNGVHYQAKRKWGDASPVRKIKVMLLDDPLLTTDEVLDKLKNELGPRFKMSRHTINTVRSDTRDSYRVLVNNINSMQELAELKKALVAKHAD